MKLTHALAYGRGEEARLKCPDRKDHGGRASDLSGEAGACRVQDDNY